MVAVAAAVARGATAKATARRCRRDWQVTQAPQAATAAQTQAVAALAEAERGNREDMEALLHFLATPSIDGALRAAEKLSKAPLAALVAWQQRWLYDVFSLKLSGKIRYYPRYQRELAALAGRVSTGSLNRAIKAAGERRAVADHPLSAKLFVEDMLLEYTSCCA